MRVQNNKEIIENTITAVYFLVADHKIQGSAQLKKKTKTNNKLKKKAKPTVRTVVRMCPDSQENFPPHVQTVWTVGVT